MQRLIYSFILCLSLVAVQVAASHHAVVHHSAEITHVNDVHHDEHPADVPEHIAELCTLCHVAKQAMDASLAAPVLTAHLISFDCEDIIQTASASSYRVAWHSRAPPVA